MTGVGCATSHRLGTETATGFAPDAGTGGVEDYTFAFHDSEEIGPVMLKRVAKKTGLTPEDL